MRRVLLYLIVFAFTLSYACVNLTDPTTFGTAVYSPGPGVYYINSDVTLCEGEYNASYEGPFLVINGSYTLDCNQSILNGYPGAWAVQGADGSAVYNCELRNFDAGIVFLNETPDNGIYSSDFRVHNWWGGPLYFKKVLGSYDRYGLLDVVGSGDIHRYLSVSGSYDFYYYSSPKSLGYAYVNGMHYLLGYIWYSPSYRLPLAASVDSNFVPVKSTSTVPSSRDPSDYEDSFISGDLLDNGQLVLMSFSNYSVGNSSRIFIQRYEQNLTYVSGSSYFIDANNGGIYLYPQAGKLDREGNLLVVGEQKNVSLGTMDAFILKTDPISKAVPFFVVLHLSNLNDSFYDVVADQNNNYIAVGNNGSAIIVAKFDSTGNLVWSKNFDVTGEDDVGLAVTVTPSNYIVVGGAVDNYTSSYLLYLDPNGNQITSFQYTSADTGYSYEAFTDVFVAPDGYVYALGFVDTSEPYSRSSNSGWLMASYSLPSELSTFSGSITIENITFVGPSVYIVGHDWGSAFSIDLSFSNLTFVSDDGSWVNLPYSDLTDILDIKYAWGSNILIDKQSVDIPSDLDPSFSTYNVQLKINCSNPANLQFMEGGNPTLDSEDNFANSIHGSEYYPPSYTCVSDDTVEFQSDILDSVLSVHINPQVCLDPYDPSTYYGRVFALSNRSFYLNDDIKLCQKDYTLPEFDRRFKSFLIINGSYYLDCSYSNFSGSPYMAAVLVTDSDSKVSNCLVDGPSVSAFATHPIFSRMPESPESIYFYEPSPTSDGVGSPLVLLDDDTIYTSGGDSCKSSKSVFQILKHNPITMEPTGDWKLNLTSESDSITSLVVNDDVAYISGFYNKTDDIRTGFVMALNLSDNYAQLWNITTYNCTLLLTEVSDGLMVFSKNSTGSLLFKLDYDGNLQWINSYSINIMSVLEDFQGNYIFTADNFYVAKVSSSGTTLWNTYIPFSPYYDHPKRIVILPDNRIFVSVDTMFLGWDKTGWGLVELDSNGNILYLTDYELTYGYPDAPYTMDYLPSDPNYLLMGGHFNWNYQTTFVGAHSSGKYLGNVIYDLYSEGQGFDYLIDMYIHPAGVIFALGGTGSSLAPDKFKWDDRYFARFPIGSASIINNVEFTNITFLRKSLFYLTFPKISATVENITLMYNDTSSKIVFDGPYSLNDVRMEEGYNIRLHPNYIQFLDLGINNANISLDADCSYSDASTRYVVVKNPARADYETALNNGTFYTSSYTCSGDKISFSVNSEGGYTYYDNYDSGSTIDGDDLSIIPPASLSSGILYNFSAHLVYNNGSPIVNYPIYICESSTLEPTLAFVSDQMNLTSCAVALTNTSGDARVAFMPSNSVLGKFFNKTPDELETFVYSGLKRDDLYNMSVVDDFYISRGYKYALVNRDQLLYRTNKVYQLIRNVNDWLSQGGGLNHYITVYTKEEAVANAVNLTTPLLPGVPYLLHVRVWCLPCNTGVSGARVKLVEKSALSPIGFPQSGGYSLITLEGLTNESGEITFLIIPTGEVGSVSAEPYSLELSVYDEFDRLLVNSTIPVTGDTYVEPSAYTPEDVNNNILSYFLLELQRLYNRLIENLN